MRVSLFAQGVKTRYKYSLAHMIIIMGVAAITKIYFFIRNECRNFTKKNSEQIKIQLEQHEL